MIYIVTGDIILEMSVTTDIDISYNSDVTQHKLEQGFSIADHITNKNKRFSIKGLVTDVKVYRTFTLLPSDSLEGTRDIVVTFFEDVEAIRQNRELVTFYFDPRLNQSSGVKNCVLKNVRFTSDVAHGGAYTVNMEVEQVRVTEAAESIVTKRQANPDNTDNESKNGNQSKNEEDITKSLPNIFF